MAREYRIYKIKSPSGKSYIGLTKQTVKERWRQHCQKAASTKKNHPFLNAIRKYGKDSFIIETICSVNSESEAICLEMSIIAIFKPEYNISPGGDYDCRAGVQALKAYLKDAKWREGYISALKKGIEKSEKHNSPDILKDKCARAAAWRKNNPKAAYSNSRRASRIAKKKISTKKSGQKQKAINKLELHRRRKTAVKKVWAKRTKTEKDVIRKKISESMKKYHASLPDREKQNQANQLKQAREKIDHKIRKTRQAQALREYWTPERRLEFSKKRKHNAS